MTTDIQNTDLYKKFIKALDIHDMRADDNPFVVKCCEIAKEYAKLSPVKQVTDEEVMELSFKYSPDADERGCYRDGMREMRDLLTK